MLFDATTSSGVPTWLPIVAGLGALAVSLFTFLVGPWAEVRKRRGQRGESEREKLQDLIEKYHGRMLEAAVDWDRRMGQLYQHVPEPHERPCGSPYGTDHPSLDLLRGRDFLDPQEYLFRSYVFRFLALCALARKFEAEAFYIDAQFASRKDFDFLKFAKAFLWAMTTSDLSEDEFPGQSHFPNDQFRPLLDRCYRPLNNDLPLVVDKEQQREVIFDIAYLHQLVGQEFESLYRQVDENGEERVSGLGRRDIPDRRFRRDNNDFQVQEGDLSTPGDLHKVVAYFDGLHRDTTYVEQEARLRVHRWDRLCVLHLLVMGFINRFGYPWQVARRKRLAAAVEQMVDPDIARKFAAAIQDLGFGERKAWVQGRAAVRGKADEWRGAGRPEMKDIRVLLNNRVKRATAGDRKPTPARLRDQRTDRFATEENL
jgi:hypothetical protein